MRPASGRRASADACDSVHRSATTEIGRPRFSAARGREYCPARTATAETKHYFPVGLPSRRGELNRYGAVITGSDQFCAPAPLRAPCPACDLGFPPGEAPRPPREPTSRTLRSVRDRRNAPRALGERRHRTTDRRREPVQNLRPGSATSLRPAAAGGLDKSEIFARTKNTVGVTRRLFLPYERGRNLPYIQMGLSGSEEYRSNDGAEMFCNPRPVMSPHRRVVHRIITIRRPINHQTR